jgi:hypothetical protein
MVDYLFMQMQSPPCDAVVYDPTPEDAAPLEEIHYMDSPLSRWWRRTTIVKRTPHLAILIECENGIAGLVSALMAALTFGLYVRMINPRRMMCSTVPPGRWMLEGHVHSLPVPTALAQ